MREIHEVPKFVIVNGVRKPKDNVLENIIFAPKSCTCYLEEMLDFSNFDFCGVKLSNVRFEYCNMMGVSFLGASFDNVEFVACAFEIKNDDLPPFNNAGIRTYYTTFFPLDHDFKICTVESKDMHFLEDTDGESIIGYKKLYLGEYKYVIAKLRIPFYADRVVYKNEKCRASCAEVLDIFDYLHRKHYSKAVSMYYNNSNSIGNLLYKVGHMVYSDSFDDKPMNVCTHGIHFFLTEKEAKNY